MPFAFSIAPYNRHFTSFRPCEEVEASSGRGAPLGYARIARGVCTSLEVNGRSCRVGGMRKCGMERSGIYLDVGGFLVLPHPPTRQGRPFAICSVGEGMGVWDGRL